MPKTWSHLQTTSCKPKVPGPDRTALDKNGKFALALWEHKISAYTNQNKALEKNLLKAYAIVWSQYNDWM